MNRLAKIIGLVLIGLPLGFVLGSFDVDVTQWQFWARITVAMIFGAAIGLVMGDGQ